MDCILQICEVKVAKSPNNVAYDSHKLETHMDAPQYESQPGLSLFQCVRYFKLKVYT